MVPEQIVKEIQVPVTTYVAREVEHSKGADLLPR
jgi:hypothetical protein